MSPKFTGNITKIKTKKNNETKNNEKGDWEYNFLQKKKNNNNNEEENIKVKLCPENVFDPKMIHSYINPQPKKEELLYQRKINGEILNKTEVIILTNYLNKKEQLLNEDISALEKFGLNAKPQTDEGRTRLLLLTLEYQINKNNNDLICNIYLRLCENQFKITPAIEKDFAKSLTIMREIVEKCDLIKIQFEKFSDQMPPLNAKGFQKFDDWQVQVINYIDENKSIVVSAPTSAGKTVLCGYVATKGKTMIVVPTDALAWQLSSYIGKILNKNIPIITKTYQTIPKRDLLVELINNSQCIVGTADSIVDFLPLINIKFEWIIFDEIHTIAMPEGSSMEIIAKIYKDIPFLSLSATIGNIGELTTWFQSLNINRNVTSIICDKRFFNLQRYYYKTDTNKLEIIHPLSLVEIENFVDGSILKKNIQPTPIDTWTLYQHMCIVFGDLKKLNHKEYFDSKERIELSKADKFFNDLIKYLVDNYDKEKITTILDKFKNISYSEETVDLVKLAFLLKAEDKTPTIIFQKNTFACLRIVRQFAKVIEELENKQFPRLYAQRLKEQKKFRRLDKQNEKEKDKSDNSSNSKKEQKQFLDSKNTEETFIPTALQEPTIEFTLNHDQLFAEGIVEEWSEQLKKFYPGISEEYHFIIKLLWRGVGVYAKGLPDTYLRLVQSLATKKQLAIVFSDMSLVFGISMPFRTVVIYRDSFIEDDLDTMLYHQMVGRAGRRGLDKKGNIIFAGYSQKRIKQLSTCSIPDIVGCNNLNFAIPHASRLAKINNNTQDWEFIFTHCLNKELDEDTKEQLEGIKSNYENGWNFAINNDINHLHMMWILRHSSNESISISYIIPYLTKAFGCVDPSIENNQINIAHFLSYFVNKYETDNTDYLLPEYSLFEETTFSKIFKIIEDLELGTTKNIDGRVWFSIKNNKLFKCVTEKEADILHQRLMEFGNRVKAIQHFYFHNKITIISRLLGKLLTRIWWIYHTSSQLMIPINNFNEIEYKHISDDSDSDEAE